MGETKFGHSEESSKLNLSINQQRNCHLSRRALIFGFINLLAAIFFYFEMKVQYISQLLKFEHPVVWYSECFLAALFTINMAVDFSRYILFTVSATRNPVELTNEERVIFGVKDKAYGFKTTPTRSRVHSDPTNTSSSSYRHRASPSTSYMNTSNNEGASFHSRHSVMEGSNSFVSPNVFSNSFVSSYSPTRPTTYSTFSRPPSGSPHTPVSSYSPIHRESSSSYLKSRHQSTPLTGSPVAMGSDEVITDAASLQSYLKAYEEKEKRNQLSSSDLSPSGSPSFWTYNRTAADFTPVLRKYQYQLASRSPQSSSSRNDDDDPDFPATYAANEVWSKVHISKDTVDEWTANLRKWIYQSILKPLVEEIDAINTRLTQLGTPELKIGEVSLTSLKQVTRTKAQHLPTLNAVLPYLDISTNQEYLVTRIRDLGAGGSISEFRWNSGGVHKGRKWQPDLPSDSAIVMHLLCSYFNFRLPPHPKYPDGKIFTSKHFMKTPDKPDLKKKDNLILYQSKVNPPHYKLIIGDDTWDLPKGRSNMFQCILLFIHHIKTKEHGMLGRVNLGASGVNVLWIVEE